MTTSSPANQPPAPSRVEIPNFPQDKRLAVTTSWDDGVVEDRRVVEAFNKWGLKGTFNLCSGFFTRTGKPNPATTNANIDASEVARLYQGHEVAIHSVSHPDLTRLDPSQITRQILDDRAALEDLVGYPVRGMAYPFGTYNRTVIDILRTALGIVYARTVENAPFCFPTPEPLAWPATMHQFGHTVAHPHNIADAVNQRWDALYNHPHKISTTFFVWAHSYEFDRHSCWDQLEKIYKPLANKPDVWYCTNIQLFDYEAARNRLVIAANRRTAYNPSALPVTIKLDGQKLLEIPPLQITPLI